jgi:hypothetical protein
MPINTSQRIGAHTTMIPRAVFFHCAQTHIIPGFSSARQTHAQARRAVEKRLRDPYSLNGKGVLCPFHRLQKFFCTTITQTPSRRAESIKNERIVRN